MAARVFHASIFQTFICHYRNENTSFKTSKWKEKFINSLYALYAFDVRDAFAVRELKAMKSSFEHRIHLSQSEDISIFRIHTRSGIIF